MGERSRSRRARLAIAAAALLAVCAGGAWWLGFRNGGTESPPVALVTESSPHADAPPSLVPLPEGPSPRGIGGTAPSAPPAEGHPADDVERPLVGAPVRKAGIDLDGDARLWKSGGRSGLLEAWRLLAKDHPAEPGGMHARDLILATTLEDGEPATLTDDAAEWIQHLCEATKERPGKRRYAGCFWTEAGDRDPAGRMVEALVSTGRTTRPPLEKLGMGGICEWVFDALRSRLDGADLDSAHQTLRGATLEFLAIATSYLRADGGGKTQAAQTSGRAALVDGFLAKYGVASERPVAAMVGWLRSWYPK